MNASQRTNWLWGWLCGYIVLASAVIGGMIWVRNTVLTNYSTPESIADWRAWREDVRQQQVNPENVQRRVPKSDEPPALVLMRDYFVVSFSGALFFTSLLYCVMAWLVTGALRSN